MSRRCTTPESTEPDRRSRSPGRSRSIFPTSSSSAACSICRPTIRRRCWCQGRETREATRTRATWPSRTWIWNGPARWRANATIIFVYSTDVMTSVQYAIDQKLAPVVSVSYGSCELETPASEYNAFVAMGASKPTRRESRGSPPRATMARRIVTIRKIPAWPSTFRAACRK